LIFENGLGFESWLDDMTDASGSSAERVVVSDGVDHLVASDEDHDDDHDEDDHAEEDHGHDHGPIDPHIWGDVANASHAVAIIRDRLMAIDPANAGDYEANAAAYLTELHD